jgi:acyl-CoA thioesterase-1
MTTFRWAWLAPAFVLAAALVACGTPNNPPPDAAASGGPGDRGAGVEAAGEPAAGGGPIVIAFLGDSLTAGLGLLESQAYPARIREMFAADGYDVDIINGGVSGDTTAGGLRRYEQLLSGGTQVLVVALGANDALRGLTVRQTHDNLAAIIEGALDRGVAVIVAGMEAPTNLGEDYRTAFHDVFIDLVREYKGDIAVVPFLLEGVAGNPALNQADGIHPNEAGARVVASVVYPAVKNVVERIAQPR